MEVAKVFENGRSQAVRLPKQFRFNEDEVFAKKVGDIVMLMPKTDMLIAAHAKAEGLIVVTNNSRGRLWGKKLQFFELFWEVSYVCYSCLPG